LGAATAGLTPWVTRTQVWDDDTGNDELIASLPTFRYSALPTDPNHVTPFWAYLYGAPHTRGSVVVMEVTRSWGGFTLDCCTDL
jgi:hypothetical protein